MRWIHRFTLAAAVAFISPVVGGESPPEPDQAALDALITTTMQDWKVPGASVAIVRGDQVFLAKGYGFRDVELKKPATEKTLFRLASVTKSFTAAGVAALVTQGKLEWNKPVRDYLPEFQLYDKDLTARVTPVDLLSHRTGLPRHDALWYYNRDLSREELIHRLRYLEPSKDLRESFQYNNLMFLTAGYLTGRTLDTSWEEAIRKLIFQPLSMTASNFTIEAMEKSRDHAAPYQKDKQERVQRVPHYTGNNIAPAGQINSNAEEMGRYLLMLLNGGSFEGRQVLSEADVQKMISAQMVVSGPPDPRYPELGDSAYGLGLSVSSYRGHRLVHHGGAIDGYRSNLALLPEDKVGVVVLSNLGGVGFADAVTYDLFDRLLGLPPRDWSRRFLEDERKGKAAQDEAEGKGYTARKTGTQPSHPLTEYAGHYEHPGYGTVRIEQSGGTLSVRYGYLNTGLGHFHYDTFEFVTDPVAEDKSTLRFETDLAGEIASLSIPLEPLVPAIVFQRVADPEMRTREFLAPLVGAYELGALILDVVLREDGVLQVRTPTGQVFDLEPARGTTFRIKERTGWSLEFKKDSKGAVAEAVFHQPGSSSVMKRKP